MTNIKKMKRLFLFSVVLAIVLLTSCTCEKRAIVIISTNDMHAQIQRFPLLATAVQECRDTATVVLVDAGDRWTGNAYVDMAEGRLPIIELMNKVGYSVATLGNHEFDAGHAVLDGSLGAAEFSVVCANFKSDTVALRNIEPYIIKEIDGVKIGFVGVVTNYEGGGKPAGVDEVFRKLTFEDPKKMATKYAEIEDECDFLVLISHMGSTHDREFLENNQEYDVLVSGHSHEVINEMVEEALLIQTGKSLANIGVTVLDVEDGVVDVVGHKIVSLDKYEADPEYTKIVEMYYDDPKLKKSVGTFTAPLNLSGFANFMVDAISNKTGVDLVFLNLGSVRLDSHPAGDMSVGTIFSLEPFGTQIWTMKMTPAQMRHLIISKFNDKENTKESHRVDLISTTPYVIEKDADGEAVDVKFAELKEGKEYSVAMGDYVVRKYKDLEAKDKKNTSIYITDALIKFLKDKSPVEPNNNLRQSIKQR